MIQLELGKFYIDRNYDVICIFNKTDGVRLKGGAFIDLFIGIKLNEDLDLKDREFYLYDIQGNEYNKEYHNSPCEMVMENAILEEDNRNVIIANDYLAYKTSAIVGSPKPTYKDYTIDSVDNALNKISFLSAVTAKVGQIVWIKNADEDKYTETDISVKSIENSDLDIILDKAITLKKDGVVQFRDKVLDKKVYCNLNLLQNFELNEKEFILKIGNDEIDLCTEAKLLQIKKYLGVFSEVFK